MKDFDKWNELKKRLERKPVHFYCKKRQIWCCSLGLNIGSEQDGKNELFERPVLIVNVFGMGMMKMARLDMAQFEMVIARLQKQLEY